MVLTAIRSHSLSPKLPSPPLLLLPPAALAQMPLPASLTKTISLQLYQAKEQELKEAQDLSEAKEKELKTLQGIFEELSKEPLLTSLTKKFQALQKRHNSLLDASLKQAHDTMMTVLATSAEMDLLNGKINQNEAEINRLWSDIKVYQAEIETLKASFEAEKNKKKRP